MKNNSSIFLSVLIPTWNRCKSVLDAVKSAVPVTDKIEILVVDDGSDLSISERLLEGLKSFSHVKLFRNMLNLGMVRNWNQCISHASGQWMGILCDDDRYEDGAIPRAISTMESCQEPSLILQDPAIRAEVLKCPAGKETVRRLRLPIVSGNFWHRQIVVKLGGFDERFIYSADAEYWYRIASRFPVVKVKAPFAVYRRHDSNYMWATWRKQDFLEKAEALVRTVASYRSDNEEALEKEVDNGLWRTLLTIVETVFLSKGMSDIFLKYFPECWKRAYSFKRKADLIKTLIVATVARLKGFWGR